MVKYILLILQKLYLDRKHVYIRFQCFAQGRVIFQSGGILFRCDNHPFVFFQLQEPFFDELQVFRAEVVVVAESQQTDVWSMRFHFFHQWGGRGDARNEKHLFVAGTNSPFPYLRE